jgi:hypothetical protein
MLTNINRFYSFQAEANALGGILEEPFRKIVPTLAPVSLPCVGGFATARSEGFTLDEIVRCSAAYTRVSGQEESDGSSAILVTAVIEKLNLLEVLEADRIVAQLSIWTPADGGPTRISTAGTHFEGLRLAGRRCSVRPNPRFLDLTSDKDGRAEGVTASDVAKIGAAQAKVVTAGFKGGSLEAWAEKRFGWMGKAPANRTGCSLVDGFDGVGARECGHVFDLPGFGRFAFGELLVGVETVQLVSVRAELGCPVKGRISVNCVGGSGVGNR